MQRIFKWFTLDDAAARIDWFSTEFTADEFSGEDKVLFCFIEYCSRLSIPALAGYFDAFMRTEGKSIVKKYNIKLADMGNFNYDDPAALEEAARIIVEVASAKFRKCLDEDLNTRSFKVDMAMFMKERQKERMIELMTGAFTELNAGSDVQDVNNDMIWKLQTVADKYDASKLSKLDFMEGKNYQHGEDSRDVMRFLFKTNIPCIDGDVGGCFSKQLIAMEGAPGTGKTRLAMIHFAYQCAVISKKDVYINELELSAGEIRNMLVAYHIVKLWNGAVKIPDSLMNKGQLTQEQEQYVNAARIDLFESGKYGKFIIDTDKIYVERLETKMYPLLRRNPNIAYWIIDYAGLVASRPEDKYAHILRGYEIIQELYKRVKDIIKAADIGALIVNQFNGDGIEASKAGKQITPGHVEGGQIISRHADYEIAMTATEEQILASMAMLSTVKVRAAKGFKNVLLSLDLAVSIFRQIKQSAVA